MFWAVDVSSNYCTERNTPYKSCIERDEEIWSQNNFGYTHICLWLRALSGPELGYIQVLRTTVRGNCQSYEKIVKSYSCPHWVQLLFISGSSSPGAIFSPIGTGPRGSGWWNGDRDKHWEQLLFISGPSSPGAVFSPIGSGPGGSGWWNGIRDKHWVQLLSI